MKYLNKPYLSNLIENLKPKHTFSTNKSMWGNSGQDTYSYGWLKWKRAWKKNVFGNKVAKKFTLTIFNKILFSKGKSKWLK